MFVLDKIKLRTYYLKDDNVKLWVELIIAVTFLDAVATVDHLKAIITYSLWNCTFSKSKVFEKKHITAIPLTHPKLSISQEHFPSKNKLFYQNLPASKTLPVEHTF